MEVAWFIFGMLGGLMVGIPVGAFLMQWLD